MLSKPTRRAVARRCAVVAVVVVPFLSLAVANPTWAKTAGLDVWNITSAERDLADATRTHRQLAADDITVLNRITAKEALTDEVIAGRVTLADAAAQFLALSSDAPLYLTYLLDTYPHAADDERVALNVIDYATQRVEDPAERDALACRLLAELADVGEK